MTCNLTDDDGKKRRPRVVTKSGHFCRRGIGIGIGKIEDSDSGGHEMMSNSPSRSSLTPMSKYIVISCVRFSSEGQDSRRLLGEIVLIARRRTAT